MKWVCTLTMSLAFLFGFSQSDSLSNQEIKETQPIFKNQVGLVFSHDFGQVGNFIQPGPLHSSVAAAYSRFLGKKVRLMNLEATSELAYIQREFRDEPTNRDLAINIGFRCLLGKFKLQPLFELKGSTMLNVSSEIHQLIKNTNRYKPVLFGYIAGTGFRYTHNQQYMIAIKSYLEVYQSSRVINSPFGALYSQLKLAYAF